MISRFFILSYLLFHSLLIHAQQNMSLVSNTLIDDDATDIWGYVDQSGTEYAIMGAINSTRIFSLADPTNPLELINIPGDRSRWRDIKTDGDYIYVIADQGDDGLLVIDMTQVEDTIAYQYFNPLVDEFIISLKDSVQVIDSMIVDGITVFDTTLVLEVVSDTTTIKVNRCHNLYIVDGFIYLAGCNGGPQYNGVIILDPSNDPFKPEVIGIESNSYAHDVFVKGNLMYVSEIRRGALGIYDITDKTNPQLVGSQTTGFRFTHNAWTNDDATVAFTTDERSNAFVEAYDISDLENIKFLDNFRPLETQGLGVVPHNVHFHHGFLYTSYYTDGLIVTDATKADNLIQVGQYDTWPGEHGGFNGNWGTYPFLPSGLILVSDQETGLYILQSDVQRACYLEGTITDEETGLPINGVDIQIKSKDRNESISNAAGAYKTGQATSGTFEVQFIVKEYEVLNVDLELLHGECLIYDAILKPVQKLDIDIMSIEAVSEEPLNGVSVQLFNTFENYELSPTENGISSISQVNSGIYTLVAAKWGYKAFVIDKLILQENGEINVQLDIGIEDNFTFDLGWMSAGNAMSGQWERTTPVGTFFDGKSANVVNDLPDDSGHSCYVTGNGGGNAGFDDVDDGEVVLTSPMSDLSSYAEPVLRYYYWFFNDGGDGSIPNDTLHVFMTNQTDTILIDQISDTLRLSGAWQRSKIELDSLLTLNDSIQFIFKTGDFAVGHVVEAGIDGFEIVEKSTTTSTEELDVSALSFAYPNPTEDLIYLKLDELNDASDWRINLFDIDGRLHFNNAAIPAGTVSLKDLNAGMYVLHLYSAQLNKIYTQKLVKI